MNPQMKKMPEATNLTNNRSHLTMSLKIDAPKKYFIIDSKSAAIITTPDEGAKNV